MDKFESARVSIGFRKSETVIIEDEGQLSDQYVTVETKRSPDKKAIKTALKSGIAVRGARLQENQNIQIK